MEDDPTTWRYASAAKLLTLVLQTGKWNVDHGRLAAQLRGFRQLGAMRPSRYAAGKAVKPVRIDG